MPGSQGEADGRRRRDRSAASVEHAPQAAPKRSCGDLHSSRLLRAGIRFARARSHGGALPCTGAWRDEKGHAPRSAEHKRKAFPAVALEGARLRRRARWRSAGFAANGLRHESPIALVVVPFLGARLDLVLQHADGLQDGGVQSVVDSLGGEVRPVNHRLEPSPESRMRARQTLQGDGG